MRAAVIKGHTKFSKSSAATAGIIETNEYAFDLRAGADWTVGASHPSTNSIIS